MVLPNYVTKVQKQRLVFVVLIVIAFLCFVSITNDFYLFPKKSLRRYSQQLDTIQPFRLLLHEQNPNSQNTVHRMQGTSTAVRQIFNIENKDKQFGKTQNFHIKIDDKTIPNNINITLLKSLDIFNKIQVNTIYDYWNLTARINFTQLKSLLQLDISYQLITFPFNHQLEERRLQSVLTSQNQSDALQDTSDSKTNNIQYQYQQSIKMVMDEDNGKIRQQQYNYYNKKYKIGEIKNELSICIYGAGYKLFEKNKYKKFFKSIQKQNYSNFHIVYIDDNSPTNNVVEIINYLQNNNFTIKNKIQIIHNLQRLGPLANLYFWVNKYCHPQDIVVHVDPDDQLLGEQVLKVINAIYQDPQIWFLYSRYLLNRGQGQYVNGFSKQMRSTTSEYRHKFQYWDVSALRSFRKALFSKIPLEAAIEYHYNQKTGIGYPHFYQFAYDAFEIFPLLEMSGDKRVRHISDMLYVYSGSAASDEDNKCYSEHEKVDDFKFRIKTPFNQLSSISDPATYVQNYKQNTRTITTFQQFIMYQYRKCMRKKLRAVVLSS